MVMPWVGDGVGMAWQLGHCEGEVCCPSQRPETEIPGSHKEAVLQIRDIECRDAIAWPPGCADNRIECRVNRPADRRTVTHQPASGQYSRSERHNHAGWAGIASRRS